MKIQSSSHWQWVRHLSPGRLVHVQYQDRMVRGEPWAFVHSDVTGQHVRINGITRQIVRLLDSESSIEQLLAQLAIELHDDEKQALAMSLLMLANNGLISLDTPGAEAQLQLQAIEFARRKARTWHNPLAIRIALMNPDAWLGKVAQLTKSVSVALMVKVAVFLVLAGLLAVILNTRALADQLVFLARSPQQWWQVLLVYPFLKCIHEFAHALVLKRYSGAVHEMGITLLVLMPVPYVDASDSWRIESRRQRILVSAVGMLAEGAVAALGVITWLLVEPGVIHELSFALALTGSLSALLFNANPLLKFDGYQILQDLIDIPNLAPRATRYLRYLSRRYLLGVTSALSPVTGVGERKWLLIYGVGATAYRCLITLGIALYLATRFPVAGSLLALFALYQVVLKPVVHCIQYLTASSELQGGRLRAMLVSSACSALLIAIVFLVPAPSSTRAQGVVSAPMQASLYAPQSAEIASLSVTDGQFVQQDQLLLTLSAPMLTTKLAVVRSELEVIEVQLRAARINDVELTPSLRGDLQGKILQLQDLSEQVDSLQVRAGTSGQFNLDSRLMRVGQYVQAGALLGYIVTTDSMRVKAVVRESDIARVKAGVHHVSVRLAERFSESFEATLVQQTPTADRLLPSQALAGKGPGNIAVVSKQDSHWETVEPVFHLELELPPDVITTGIGGRAYITLTHDAESLGKRSWRSLRQLLLDQLAI